VLQERHSLYVYKAFLSNINYSKINSPSINQTHISSNWNKPIWVM